MYLSIKNNIYEKTFQIILNDLRPNNLFKDLNNRLFLIYIINRISGNELVELDQKIKIKI